MTAELVQIFVDGACRNNGQSNPQGGCGVYWGPFHPMNTSETLIGNKQTNNCAELSAAIIALAQCKTLKFENVEIHTDSKYVKDGITKWIQSWKMNSWKLKSNAPVLNKELWELLDMLQNELVVSWRWVEGHKNSTGNMEADELAKHGIGVSGSYWQYTARKLYENFESTFVKQIAFCDDEYKSAESQKYVDYCAQCSDEVSVSGIQCTNCKDWYHYKCTLLPPYQIYMYEGSQRKYTCMACAHVTEEFLTSNTFFTSSQSYTEDKCSRAVQTDSCVTCDTEVQTHDEPDMKVIDHESQEKTIASIMNKSISELETKFVEALDKLTSAQHDIYQKVTEINQLKQENEILRKKLDTSKMQSPPPKCNCTNIKRELENVTIENENWRRRYSELSLQKEIEVAQCDTNLKIMKQQLDCAQGQNRIICSELDCSETRIASKNDEIIGMEKTIQEQRKRLHALEDEIVSWKLHASRVDDSLLLEHSTMKCNVEMENKEKERESNKNEKRTESPNMTREAPHDLSDVGRTAEYIYPDHTEENPHTKIVRVENQERSMPRKQMKNAQKQHKTALKREIPKVKTNGKNVLIIGTSNTKYVSAKYIANIAPDVYVRKVVKYTIEQGKNYVEAENIKDYDVVLLHLFGNDLKVKFTEECLENMVDLVNLIKEKNSTAKIIISLGLPRNDTALNRKTDRLNVAMKEKFAGDSLVKLCDNGNLSFRGNPSRGILKSDDHLTTFGTRKLTANFKEAIRNILNLAGNRRFQRRGNRMSWWENPYGYQQFAYY